MKRTLCLLAAALLPATAWGDEPLPDLPRLGVSDAARSVIGVSSGGYMASQLAVAWPRRFEGLAVLAAGPWGCAEGSLGQALRQCMSTRNGLPDLNDLARKWRDYEARGLVGSAEALAELHAFVWHGEADDVVAPELGTLLAEQLADWLADPEVQLELVRTPNVGHGWPVTTTRTAVSPEQLADCREGGGTHLLACNIDIAGQALTSLHGELAPPVETGAAAGRLARFDQSDFAAKGLADTGYVFVPATCEEGGCDLSLALHGCGMGHELIGETFMRHNGLNDWAATNRRVVLYPQAETSLANPQGCWDWWGFAESTWQLSPLHDTREGTQVRALMAMLEHLSEPAAKE